MVQFQLTIPEDPDPLIFQVINYIKLISEGKNIPFEDSMKIYDICEKLRDDDPEEPVVFHLSAMVAFLTFNREASLRFWGQALTISPDYSFARACFDELIEEHDYWTQPKDYLEIISSGWVAIRDHYAECAGQEFEAGNLDGADRFAQKISALANINFSPIEIISLSRKDADDLAAKGELEQLLSQTMTIISRYWATQGTEDIVSARQNINEKDDRRQMTEIVSKLVSQAELKAPVIVELGSYFGFNLDLFYQSLKDHCSPVCIGIEPNRRAAIVALKTYPHVQTCIADHVEMIKGTVSLPDHIDLCVISRVLMILHPDEVDKILKFLYERAETIVLCEDIFNVDGDIPVVRKSAGPFCIAHNFRQRFQHAGYEISDLIMADVPDRELNGFIIARRIMSS